MLVNSIGHLSELGADSFTINSLLKLVVILKSTLEVSNFADIS